MSKLLRQQSGHAFIHLVFARAAERFYNQDRRTLPASCKKYVFSISPIFQPDVNNSTPAELHNQKNQPNLKVAGTIGMPLDQFTNEAYEGLASGKEEVAIGDGQRWYEKVEPARQELFRAIIGR